MRYLDPADYRHCSRWAGHCKWLAGAAQFSRIGRPHLVYYMLPPRRPRAIKRCSVLTSMFGRGRGTSLPSPPSPRQLSVTGSIALPPERRDYYMPHYQTYFIGRDGEFKKAIELDCAHDGLAVESTKQLVNGLDVELWQHDRLVRRFKSDDKAAS
jgi:hypothetical protein